MVEQSPIYPKVKGSSPAFVTDTRREKWKKVLYKNKLQTR
jgi:hypothetical protein